MKKILITGSNGLLGQNILKTLVCDKNIEVFAISRGENQLKKLKGFKYFDLDITNSNQLSDLIKIIKPQHIIHTAAMTNVDECELNKAACDKINVEPLVTLVSLCRLLDIHLIQISTDFIFDGVTGYYKEEDEPNPINYYGVSKLKSEQIIAQANIKYTILRTILVYGITNQLKNNIVLWVKRSLENKQQINIVTDQLRMPTLVDDLVESCIYSLSNHVFGVFNVSSGKLISIYDMAIIIADMFNLDKSLINPIPTAGLNQPAKRPPKTGFDLKKSISQLNLAPNSFREDLQVFKIQLARFEPS